MGQLTNTPKVQTPLRLEARKSYSLAIWFETEKPQPFQRVDLTGATVTLVMAKRQYKGGTVVLTKVATIDGPIGLARLNFQAADLNVTADTYDYIVTLVTSDGYSVPVLKGEIEVLPNASLVDTNVYTDPAAAQALTVTLVNHNVVKVVMPAPQFSDLDIGMITTLAPGSNPTASLSGSYPKQYLNLGLPTTPSGSGAVFSVNSKTGAVTLNKDDIPDGTTGKTYTQTEKTKLAGLTQPDLSPYALSADPTFSGLTTVSGFRMGQLLKTADYTVQPNDPSFISVATGAGNVTITLPAAAPAGTVYIIKKTDGNGGNLTISANTDTFTIPSLNSQYDVMGLISTGAGSNYNILFSNKPVRIQASGTDLGTVLSNLGMRSSGSAYSITTSGTATLTGTTNLSNYTTGGARFSTYQVRTAAVTLTTGTAEHQYLDATTAAFDVTLPATTTPGLQFTFRRVDNVSANTLRILGTFDSTTNYTLRDAGDWVTVQSTSTSGTWRVVMASRQWTPQGNTTDLGVALSNLGIRQTGTAYPITTSGAVALSGATAMVGNLRLASAIKSATTTLTTSDVPFIMCDATTAAFTITLPSTTTVGYLFHFKKVDSVNPVTITSAGTPLIDGLASITLSSLNEHVWVISTGVAGTWRILSRSDPVLLPSYLANPVVLRKSWDPASGAYNFNTRTMKKARAGLGRAGTGGKMQAVFLGDSTMIGFDGTATVEANSYPRRVQNAITQLTGIRSAGTGFVPAVANNDRWGFTGTVDRVTYPGLCTIYPSSTATYTSIVKGTSVEAIYSNQSNAGGTITIDGGAPISLPVSGAATLRREVLATGLADTTHTLLFTPASGGYLFLAHVAVRHSTGLEFHNLSVGGMMADFGTATTNWSSAAAAPTTKTSVLDPITAYITDPDLFVIAIGGNDLYQGDTNVHAIAGAKKLRDIYPNASIIMIQGWRLGVVPAATANDYLERKYNLADQYDFAVHDFQAYSGDLTEATALGLLGADSAHPKNEAVFGWGLSTGKAIAS